MADIAAYCEARERLQPAVERHEGEMRVVWRGSFQCERYGNTELSLLFPALPRPHKVILIDKDGTHDLELGRSYVWTAEGRFMLNMPITAKLLRIVFA
jgi:hypothetical protein